MNRFLIVSRNEGESAIIRKRIEFYRYQIGEMAFNTCRPPGIKEGLASEPTVIIYNTRDLDMTTRNICPYLSRVRV